MASVRLVVVVVVGVGVAAECVGGGDGIWVGEWEVQLPLMELKGKRVGRE